MKPSFTTSLLVTLVTLSTVVAVAQSGPAPADPTVRPARATGSVSGRVSNQALEVFLEGARVALVGANRWVLTDREGRFELANVPAGAATLEVSYTGLDTQRVAVEVRPDPVLAREIGLRSEVYVMDRFTVASIREGQAAAITQQRNAANGKNVAATAAFGNIADGNAAEALRLLPGIHFKYSASANTILRASYASTFGRPGFGTIFPDRRINYDTSPITQNKPGLVPQESSNYDVSVEQYFEPVGVISAGVFRKDIRKFLFSTVVVIPSGTDNGFDGEYAGWDLSNQASGGSARVQGLELNYSQQLSFLCGLWSGFGVFANFTYLETAGNYGRPGEAPNSELVNFTPHVASGGISYSRGRFTTRVNANHIGAYLRAYNADPALRSYRMPRLMVDLKVGFKVSRKLTLFADGSNIFNSGMVWFNGGNRDRVTDIRDHGVRIQAGLNGSL